MAEQPLARTSAAAASIQAGRTVVIVVFMFVLPIFLMDAGGTRWSTATALVAVWHRYYLAAWQRRTLLSSAMALPLCYRTRRPGNRAQQPAQARAAHR
jgi:hypothetical protein